MLENIKIIGKLIEHPTVSINSDTADQLGILENQKYSISLGRKKTPPMSVTIDDGIANQDIVISTEQMSDLNLSSHLLFDCKKEGSNLALGPFIGVLARKTNAGLYKILHAMATYVESYEEIRGCVIVFALEGVNEDGLTITGYVFNPQDKKWNKGTYQYPDAIFAKIAIPSYWREYFNERYKGKIFNNKSMDKWEVYSWLQRYPEIKSHLPYTLLVRNVNEVMNYLNQHRSVFLKPVSGLKGNGIMKLTRIGNTVIFQESQKCAMNTKYCSIKDARLLIAKKCARKSLIAQQALQLKEDNHSVIDFRLTIDKNMNKRWVVSAFLARKGVMNSIVSNRSSGGKVEDGTQVLMEVFRLSETDVITIKEYMINLAILIAEKMDATSYHFGKLALDLALDEDMKVWVIEVNNRSPNDTIVLSVDKVEEFLAIRKLNMLYTKSLAGFSD